jgi:hypothetical protein
MTNKIWKYTIILCVALLLLNCNLVPNSDENIQQNNESSLPSQNVTLSNTPYGNSISNLVNCAKVAYYDGWVYVSYV